jgi:uncharacterized membrane protein YqjE
MMSDEDDDAGGAPRAPSLVEAASNLGARALGLATTRIELASVEMAEARVRLIKSLLLVGAALLVAFLALTTISFGIVVYFWDGNRMAAITVLAVIYVVAAVILWYRYQALSRDAPTLFAATLAALRADAAALRREPREPAP